MRLIRPAPLPGRRGTAVARAATMIVVGAIASAMLAFVPHGSPAGAGLLGIAAALGFGVGLGYLGRALRQQPNATGATELTALLGAAFDDSYTLIVGPRIPGATADLAALLVGPPGVRAMVVRRWNGRYRVRGRAWDYHARGGRGWIACRTNPSFDAQAAGDAVSRWAASVGLERLPLAPAIVFPYRHSRVVLEEPAEEIVTADNAPWWAQRIGRVKRLDASAMARLVEAVMAASEATAAVRRAPAGRLHVAREVISPAGRVLAVAEAIPARSIRRARPPAAARVARRPRPR